MVLPSIGSRLKEPRDDPGVGINAGEVGSLPKITFWTGQGQVLDGVSATVLPWQDVVDVEPQGGVPFGHPAILAAVPGAFPDELPRRRIHQFGEEGFSVA